MTTRRQAKAAEAVRETVSSTILFELKDPRVQHVTVLRAEVAPDLRTAKVYVSVMGEPRHQSLCMHGLESARGFIQAKLADRLQTRYTPVLKFVLDQGVKRSVEASRLLRDVLAAEAGESPAEAASNTDDDRETPGAEAPAGDEPAVDGSEHSVPPPGPARDVIAGLE
jgi:ribosome-binding factor A